MTGEILGNLPAVLQIVNLTVLLSEMILVSLVFLPLLNVDEGVAWTSDQDGIASLVKWIEGDLEVAESAVDRALIANACLGNKLLALPIPEKDLPIRLSCQCDNHTLFFVTERARDELLRVVCVAVLDLLG